MERSEIKQKTEFEWMLKKYVSPDDVIGEELRFKKPADWILWMHTDTISRIKDLEQNLVETIFNLRAEIYEAEDASAQRAGQERDIVVDMLAVDVTE